MKQWRERVGLTQIEAAGRLGVSARTYQNWEGGNFAPSRDLAARVHAVAGIPTTDWSSSKGGVDDWVAPS